jgi:predicted  nucleic acid-binding Zn-ribbon protein
MGDLNAKNVVMSHDEAAGLFKDVTGRKFGGAYAKRFFGGDMTDAKMGEIETKYKESSTLETREALAFGAFRAFSSSAQLFKDITEENANLYEKVTALNDNVNEANGRVTELQTHCIYLEGQVKSAKSMLDRIIKAVEDAEARLGITANGKLAERIGRLADTNVDALREVATAGGLNLKENTNQNHGALKQNVISFVGSLLEEKKETESELKETKNELEKANTELEKTKTELNRIKIEKTQTENGLKIVEEKLESAEQKLKELAERARIASERAKELDQDVFLFLEKRPEIKVEKFVGSSYNLSAEADFNFNDI